MVGIFKIAILLVIVFVVAIIMFREFREMFACAISLHDWEKLFGREVLLCTKCGKRQDINNNNKKI